MLLPLQVKVDYRQVQPPGPSFARSATSQSAGANPGPACYNKGGEKPTVSDANLVLGYLNPDGLIGGKLPLNYKNAFNSIEKDIAKPLDIEVEKAADNLIEADDDFEHLQRHCPIPQLLWQAGC